MDKPLGSFTAEQLAQLHAVDHQARHCERAELRAIHQTIELLDKLLRGSAQKVMTEPVCADSVAAAIHATAARDSAGVIRRGVWPARTQLAK